MSALRQAWFAIVNRMANSGNVLPVPFAVRYADGSVEHIMCADMAAYDVVLGRVLHRSDAVEFMLGFDRFTMRNQGTSKGNVFTYAILERGCAPTIGMIEYDAGDVAPPREGPEIGFWYEVMSSWLTERGVPASWLGADDAAQAGDA